LNARRESRIEKKELSYDMTKNTNRDLKRKGQSALKMNANFVFVKKFT
jgi:hypothetical protein